MLVKNLLIGMKTEKHKAFLTKLIPNIPEDSILGIKNPDLKALAKKLQKENPLEVEKFLNDLPHQYLEENMLHVFFISNMKNFDQVISELEKFRIYIDNWAVSDSVKPNVFKKYTKELFTHVERWLEDDHIYSKRLAIVTMLSYFLNEAFSKDHLDLVAKNNGEDYYLKMVVAWYFSMALAKQYDHTISYIEGQILEPWTHNKAIQKAIESRQVPDDRKAYLKSLK